MPFNMFKAFSGSRNRNHRGDPTIYDEYPQGYPPAEDFHQEPIMRSQPRVLRRSSTNRRDPLFTPLPSRSPTDAEDFNEGSYIQVDSPDAVMGGALNARPGKIDAGLPPLGPALESPLLETLSEREHREHTERLHDVSRPLDRPPPLQQAGAFHSGLGRGDRVNPNAPIIMTPSPSRSSASESDHTIEALRTPSSAYPHERVIPPLPRSYSGAYVPDSRSPTDIYGSHPYEVVHDAHSLRNQEFHVDRYGRPSGYEKDSPIYYVIPGGMNVIFQDEHGNEITRVGDFSGRSRPLRPGPFVVQDEHGRELYRYDNYDRGSHHGYSDPQIVQIDSHHRRDGNYSSHGYRSGPSYRRGYDYYPDHRGHRDHRERDWRDHRDHRYRGYADYPDRNEYRDPKGYRDLGTYRDPGGHRDHGGHREYGGYREHGEHRHRGRPEDSVPGRVPSRASHRSHSHAGQLSIERPPQQYPSIIPDDGRSGRGYAASHASMPHPEDEAEISNGLEALHM